MKLIRQQADINEVQFGFIPGCGNTYDIFLETVTEKQLAKKKDP